MRAACWRAPRPGRVVRRRDLRYHDRTRQDRRSIITIMFVRDSCSKQLDSDRLAADVPEKSENSEKLTWRGERNVERDPLFAVFLCLSPSYKLSRTCHENLWRFRFWRESLASKRGTKCTQKTHVQKCMGSVILHFSSIRKVRPQNV